MDFYLDGIGTYHPPHKVTSDDLDRRFGLEPNHTRDKFGVHQRFYSLDEDAHQLAFHAAVSALDSAQISVHELDCVIYASGTSVQQLPFNAAGLLRLIDPQATVRSFDVNSSCLAFLQGLSVALALFDAKRAKRIMIVSAEKVVDGLPPDHPEAATLFSDGSAAVVISTESSHGRKFTFLTEHFTTYPSGYELCQVRSGGTKLNPQQASFEEIVEGYFFYMDGRNVYRQTIRQVPAFLKTGLAKVQLTPEDIDWIVPHQTSATGHMYLEKYLQAKPGRMLNIFAKIGNQVSVSIPTCFAHLLSDHPLQEGEHVMLFGTAAGLSLGMMVLRA